MSKNDTINIMDGSKLVDKRGVLEIFFVIYKNEWECLFNLLSKKRDVILNRAKDYCENDKERLKEQARDKYRNLSEEEKNKKENMGKIDTAICLKKKNKD